MTDLAPPLLVDGRRRPPGLAFVLLGGLLGGLTLGVVARAWMHLITDDPSFTWAGTAFIVVAFTGFGLTQAIVAAVRARARRRRTVAMARIVGAVGMAPLFTAAGAIMLPTVLGAGLAWTRTSWRPVTRGLGCAIALGPVLFVIAGLLDELGWSARFVLGAILFVAIYATIVWASQGTMTRSPGAGTWPAWARVVVLAAVTLLVLLPATGIVKG